MEAIPAKAIEDNIKNNPSNNRGKANIVLDPDDNQMKLGRFGWKAQVATLHQFAGDAYLNEMGITNPSFRNENLPQASQSRQGVTCSYEGESRWPEDDGSGVQAFADFMKFLAPAPRRTITDLVQRAQVQRGEQVLNSTVSVGGIGCASCHIPTMTTGPNDIDVPVNQPVNLYSDLLLHDIGTDDGIVQGWLRGPSSAPRCCGDSRGGIVSCMTRNRTQSRMLSCAMVGNHRRRGRTSRN